MARRVVPVPRQVDPSTELFRRAEDQERLVRTRQPDADRTVAKTDAGGNQHTIPTASSLAIYHHLGRQPSGWRIADLTATGAVVGWLRRTAWDAETITLRNDTGVTVTIKLEVF